MSDLIRQYMGLRRGPIGLPNNPSPFPVGQPESGLQPPPDFSQDMRRMESMSPDALQRMMMEGQDSYSESLKRLQRNAEQSRDTTRNPLMIGADQMMTPGVRGAGY